MSNTVTLGKRPKAFKRTITFPMLEGGECSIEMLYRYRTRKEFGAFVDTMAAAANQPAPRSGAEDDVRFSLEQIMAGGNDKNAEYILQIADGWNVDGHAFNLASVEQLCDELPGAALRIMEEYRAAIVEGRLGN